MNSSVILWCDNNFCFSFAAAASPAHSPHTVRTLYLSTNASQAQSKTRVRQIIHAHFTETDELNPGAHYNNEDLHNTNNSRSRSGSPTHYHETSHHTNSYSLHQVPGHSPPSSASPSSPAKNKGSRSSSRNNSPPGNQNSRNNSTQSSRIYIPKNVDEVNDGAPRPLSSFLTARRPISAPHRRYVPTFATYIPFLFFNCILSTR